MLFCKPYQQKIFIQHLRGKHICTGIEKAFSFFHCAVCNLCFFRICQSHRCMHNSQYSVDCICHTGVGYSFFRLTAIKHFYHRAQCHNIVIIFKICKHYKDLCIELFVLSYGCNKFIEGCFCICSYRKQSQCA